MLGDQRPEEKVRDVSLVMTSPLCHGSVTVYYVKCEPCTLRSSVIVNSALSRMIHTIMPCAFSQELSVALAAFVVYCVVPGTLLQVHVCLGTKNTIACATRLTWGLFKLAPAIVSASLDKESIAYLHLV